MTRPSPWSAALAAGCLITLQPRPALAQATSLTLGPPGASTFANDATGPRIATFPSTQTTGDAFLSPDSLLLGGLSEPGNGSALTIRGAPYGYLDTGTLLSIVSTEHSIFNSRAGVNSGYDGFPGGMVAMSQDPDFNSVNLYNQTTALPPRIILGSGVSYSATQILLATPLSAAQLAQMRRNMWVTTNSIDPTMASVVSGTLATAATSGSQTLTLSGTVNAPVGSYVKAFHGGINGPTVTASAVASSGGNTVVTLSAPLVDGGTDAAPVTSYPAGTAYGFVTYNTPVTSTTATAVGATSLVVGTTAPIPVGTAVLSSNPGIAAGTTVTATSVSGNVTTLTLNNAIVSDAAGDGSYPAGTTYYLGLPQAMPAGQHIPTVTYGSTVTGWDPNGTFITVNGWTVPGGNRSMVGQVPSGVLDPTMPYTSQTAYLGAPTTASINNWVQVYDPSPQVPASSTPSDGENSRISQFEGLELDQWNLAKTDYSATFRGLTIGYTPLASVSSGGVSHGVLPSTDSYDLSLAGNMPTLLRFAGSPTANYLVGESLLVRGNGGVSGAAGKTGELFEHSAFMDGMDDFRLVDWLQKDSATTGAQGGSMRLGLVLNGTQGTVGAPQSQIAFNVPGLGTGSIGLFGYGGSGLSVDGQGNAHLGPSQTLTFSNSASGGGLIGSDAAGDIFLHPGSSAAQTVSTGTLAAQDGLTINGPAGINYITAPSMLVRGNAGVSGAVGSTGELFEQSGYIDGANNMRLVDWLSQDSSAVGAQGGSMHLGLIIDGAQGSVGTPQSQLLFDAAGFGTGSIGMVGYGGGGIIVNGAGNATLTKGGSFSLQNSAGGVGATLQTDPGGDLLVRSAVAGGGGLSIAAGSTVGLNTPTATVFSNTASVNASSATLGWNCSNGGGEACIEVSGDAGSTHGFAIFQDGAANTLSSASEILAVDSHGNQTLAGGLRTGACAGLALQTASGGSGGTVSSNAAGDLVLGSATGGASVRSTQPLVLATAAFASLPATGNPGAELFCTDCRKPGETAGSGTGMVVFDDGHAHWVSTAGTVAAN